MNILNVTQGSPEWAALRRQYRPASEAPIMMGASSKMSRRELVRMYATGGEREFSNWVQRNLLDKGHEIEAAARELAEKEIGEDLYPVVCADDDGYLMASLDGSTILGDLIWECKSWNEMKAACVRAGRVTAYDYWQVQQQLLISGAVECLYMVTDGTPEKTVTIVVAPDKKAQSELLAGWRQFDKDVAEYHHVEEKTAPAGNAPESLPALRIELTGDVAASNLSEFRDIAMSVIGAANTELETDQDFADAEKACKWCGYVEKRLEAAKEHALSQTSTIDELFRTIDAIKEEARQKRLSLEKLVKARKDTIRAEIVRGGQDKLSAHIVALNKRMRRDWMPVIRADFPGAVKGRKTIAGLLDAVDAELARAKIAANEMADLIQTNIQRLEEEKEFDFLFADARQFIVKPTEDVDAIIKSRIACWKEEDARRKAAAVSPPSAEVQPLEAVDSAAAQPASVHPAAKEPAAKHRWHYLSVTFQSNSDEEGATQAVIKALAGANIIATVRHMAMDEET